MSGHLEQAAAAFAAASQTVPVDHVQAATSQIPAVVQAINQAGGQPGQELIQVALSVQNDLDGISGRLLDLREKLDSAAQAVLRGGG
jgi:hypothetical protein